ncbi:uncharacterized protein [Rutidosis leptorrhynchoides]|uniref:uncharacterized protein isoform X2 n=1 Tax=Rutidosis leptorrhynchoides TaxID=125765 RepID=UPI003A990122
MIASCNDSNEPFAKTICSICYEHLKPIAEDLQVISICGHVFHELCLQQWFEYCSKGKKKCPTCNQTCSSCNVTRLYFQSVGDFNDPNLSQKLQTDKQNPEELQLECRRLEGKVKGLTLALETREKDLKNITNELCVCKEQLKKEEALKNEALDQKRSINRLLNLKTEELNKSEFECMKLKDRITVIAEEFAAFQLDYDVNLKEDEIVKLAYIATQSHSKDQWEVLAGSLAVNKKEYNKLFKKQRDTATKVTRYEDELKEIKGQMYKLKVYLEELKEKNLKLEAAMEKIDNEALRGLKTSKKIASVLNGVEHNRIDICTSQSTIKEPCVDPRTAKRSRCSEKFDDNSNKDCVSPYILIDDDVPDALVSPKFSPNHMCENINHKTTPMSSYTDEDAVRAHEIAEDIPLPNIRKLSPLPAQNTKEDVCFSAGLIAPDGTKRHLGKWCKKDQSKGLSSCSVPRQVSGDLISVGADGRGGTIKVLKSQTHHSLDSKRSSFTSKKGKFGAKQSSLQSHGGLQINHFFSKASQ